MHVHLVHVAVPQGGVAPRKRKHYGFKLDKFLGTKKSVIRIANKDNLCLARALVTDMARQEKYPDWSNIRSGRQRQGFLAKQLHQKATIPEDPCGLAEVETFQASISDYQIVVLSAEHFNAIMIGKTLFMQGGPFSTVAGIQRAPKETNKSTSITIITTLMLLPLSQPSLGKAIGAWNAKKVSTTKSGTVAAKCAIAAIQRDAQAC